MLSPESKDNVQNEVHSTLHKAPSTSHTAQGIERKAYKADDPYEIIEGRMYREFLDVQKVLPWKTQMEEADLYPQLVKGCHCLYSDVARMGVVLQRRKPILPTKETRLPNAQMATAVELFRFEHKSLKIEPVVQLLADIDMALTLSTAEMTHQRGETLMDGVNHLCDWLEKRQLIVRITPKSTRPAHYSITVLGALLMEKVYKGQTALQMINRWLDTNPNEINIKNIIVEAVLTGYINEPERN